MDKGPSSTSDKAFDWDVQLGRGATPGMKYVSIDKRKPANVSLAGKFLNFMNSL
jgi:hypothetical protein